jgi:rsbT co-antagonist protein RsbR
MSNEARSRLAEILRDHESELLAEWVQLQANELQGARGFDEHLLREHSQDFLTSLRDALTSEDGRYISSPGFAGVREILESICTARIAQGFTPSETATFVFSFKQPLFSRLRREFRDDAETLGAEIWAATVLIDKLGLYVTEIYQKGRNEVIQRQQEEMLELSTPVVKLWQGVLALPLIGTLDSARTQVVMQNLLEAVVATGSEIAIIDITGVPTVDTLVAQHLLKTVAAARLMGADCIISGIRPQIAQTIIHLGVDLNNVTTKATLADAFAVALRRSGMAVVAAKSAAPTSTNEVA